MPDQDTIDGLLVGAIDTHIHSAPDVLPRKFNDLELAQRFKARRSAHRMWAKIPSSSSKVL